MTKTGSALGTMIGVKKGGFRDLAVSNLDSAMDDYLARFEGFEALFGKQSYCGCEHCQSILSPAAYFVDLMKFIEENVTNEHFAGDREDHPLRLKNRRPDLWTLPLTCENSNKRIATLDIVNEILENHIANARNFAANLENRQAVEAIVYEQALSLPATVDSVVDSFRQPFHLPLLRLDTYLAHFGKARGDVAEVLGADLATRVIASLRLSTQEYGLVTTPHGQWEFLRRIYELGDMPLSTLARLDVQILLKPMGVRRNELGALISSHFVNGDGDAILIKPEKTNAESLQNDSERIYNLTPSRLDRMHRFTRLWRALPWSIGELDLVLEALGNTDLGDLEGIVAARRIQERLGVSVEELCGLLGKLPERSVSVDKPALVDRLFNLPFSVPDGDRIPSASATFLHPALGAAGATTDEARGTLARLLAGLRVSDEDLLLLIRRLAAPLGAAADDGAPTRAFSLSPGNLALLFRHARLAEGLRLSVNQLFDLIGLADTVARAHVATPGESWALLVFHDWWRATAYTLDDLRFITGGVSERSGDHPTPAEMAEQIVLEVAGGRDLLFADTVLVDLRRDGAPLGVTEEQSRRIIRFNLRAGAVEAANGENAYRFSPSFNPAGELLVPDGVSVPGIPASELAGLAKAFLINYHASRVLSNRLGGRLGFPSAKAKALLALVDVDLTDARAVEASNAAVVRALQGGDDRMPLERLVEAVLPFAVLLAPSVFDGQAVDFAQRHAPLFGLTPATRPGIEVVRRLSTYGSLVDSSGDVGFASRPAPIRPEDLRGVLTSFDPAGGFEFADREDADASAREAAEGLARVLRADINVIAEVAAYADLPNEALEGLQKLRRCLDLANYLGVGGETLRLMLSPEYGGLQRAADGVLAAFRAKYRDEGALQEKLRPFEDIIRTRKRDALVDYLTRKGYGRLPDAPDDVQDDSPFRSDSDLFHHFLIDVKVDACRTTSRVVAAISSCQLYIQRCLMNLEHDRHDPPQVAVPPEAIPANRWSWRKHYRTWEANRKVFLWPYLYLISALRDDMTPLCKEMEPELLQEEVNDQTVLDAYAKYMTGFEEVASLKIAGAYHDGGLNRGTPETLHLFGVTAGDPPTYYHRTVDDTIRYLGARSRWSAWRKVDLRIPVTRVAPIVFRGRLHVFWPEYKTRSITKFDGGNSEFLGYQHRMTLRFSTLRLDGSWTPTQELELFGQMLPFPRSPGVIEDPLRGPEGHKWASLDTRLIAHTEPMDEYRLGGPNWDDVYVSRTEKGPHGPRLHLAAASLTFAHDVDLFRRQLYKESTVQNSVSSSFPLLHVSVGTGELYLAWPSRWFPMTEALANTVLSDRRLALYKSQREILSEIANGAGLADVVSDHIFDIETFRRVQVGSLLGVDELMVVAGRPHDAVIEHGADKILVQASPAAEYLVTRIGTTCREKLAERLSTGGVDSLLNTAYQMALLEDDLPISPAGDGDRLVVVGDPQELDFRGPYGVYYREIFLYVPLLIADYLNSQQRFAAADRWYRYLFDPTASEEISEDHSPEEAAARRRDRVWRYREFRNQGVPRLIDILTNAAALAAYEDDPFNPWAIARARVADFQLAVAMRCVDNLLDWGDSLFSQFTMESVNEAMLLFVMAADILGGRSPDVGPCTEEDGMAWTYQSIGPLMDDSPFLFEDVEASTARRRSGAIKTVRNRDVQYLTDRFGRGSDSAKVAGTGGADGAETVSGAGTFRGFGWKDAAGGTWSNKVPGRRGQADAEVLFEHRLGEAAKKERSADFARSFVRQLMFCVPPNKELLSYWDRVEGQLFKIRHCMDIEGVRRQLELFAPEIDPRLLVRMQAAGLSLEDVLNATSGDLPPYRFTYLVEKAKSFASTCQSFGAALQSALERKDAELATQLRVVHEQNLLKLTTQVKKDEIKQAEAAIVAMERQLEAAEHQQAHYQALIDEGLIPWESAESTARHTASTLLGGAAVLDAVAAVVHLLAQYGSPLAQKYGGVELGSSASNWTTLTRDLAGIAEAVAGSSGLEAGFRRRGQDWEFNRQQSEVGVKQLTKDLEARRIALEIANRSLEIHEKSIEQTEEVFAQLRDKASGLGLLTWLCAGLHRTFRSAFNAAYSLARLTEQALRFERGDDVVGLSSAADYCDPARAGLLGPERLLADLQRLELRFIETNHRKLEIEQSFSLRQVDPAALFSLREHGTCEFTIPEFHIHRFYPGVYRAETKMVRLTVPCVTGPFTNVSATLTLLGSRMRREIPGSLGPGDRIPQLGPADEVPLRRSVSIATSTAQNDGGVFELGFRDERYMPFEGSGVVSTWKLSLPKAFRPFDYGTISDVIVRINYTALMDEQFRGAVERENRATEGTLLNFLSTNDQPIVFSLRQEFPNAFSRLVHSPPDTAVGIEITRDHFPFFLGARTLQVSEARLLVEPVASQTISDLSISVNGTLVTGFVPDASGNLPRVDLGDAFVGGIIGEHALVVRSGADLAGRLRDLGLYVRYHVGPPGV